MQTFLHGRDLIGDLDFSKKIIQTRLAVGVDHNAKRPRDQPPRDWSRDRTVEGKVHPPVCAACRLPEDCEGVWREYFEAFGDDELVPVLF
jgi:hypothetical protein